jgi:hypothetical protein
MVQTFVVEESKELIYDNDKLQEWKEKCELLGLDKQIALTTKQASPIPFEVMNTVSRRVYETICPTKVRYAEYGKTAIPLEVLSLIHLSENESYFKEIQIWYDDKSPDPLAVGIKQKSKYEWDNELYLIARWGDALRPFDELKKMAVKIYTATTKLTLKKKISDAQHKLENLELNTQLYFDAQAEAYDVSPF